jgi:hypothetical protein
MDSKLKILGIWILNIGLLFLILSFYYWIHHMLMSGVNPFISNVIVLSPIIFLLILGIFIVKKRKQFSLKYFPQLVLNLLLTVVVGIFLMIGIIALSLYLNTDLTMYF